VRLQEIYFVCKNALDEIDNFANNYSNKKEIYSADYLNEMIRIFTPLLQIDALSGLVKPFLNSNDEVFVTDRSNQIIDTLHIIVNMFDGFHINSRNQGFDMKLPTNMTMQELAKCIKDIDMAFSQCPTLTLDGDKIDFAATDVGSSWLTFVVAAVAGVSLLKRVAEFVDKCVQIRTNIATCKLLINQAKTSGVATEMMSKIIESHNVITEALTYRLANELCSDVGVNDKESIERAKYSLGLVSNWMDKGLEIYASVNAPIETKQLFPTKERQCITDSVLGKLSEKTTTIAEEELKD